MSPEEKLEKIIKYVKDSLAYIHSTQYGYRAHESDYTCGREDVLEDLLTFIAELKE